MTEPLPTPDERAELIRRGVAGQRGPLTDAAWAELARMRAARPAVIDYAPADLAGMIDGLPGPGQAFVRLAAAAVLVRQAGRQASGHLGFIAVGPTRTGKTTLARAVCVLFGLVPDDHRLRVPDQTRGALVGRHTATGFLPAAWRARPFVLFDEADKAPALARETLTYFQGDAVSMIDGRPYPIRSVPMIAANRDPDIPQEYRARSIVLDTSGFDREQVEAFAEQLDQGSAVIPLDLLPDDDPDPEVSAVFEQLRGRLTNAGQAEYPRALFLAPLVPAYAALHGVSQERAAAMIAADYLACANTVGQVAGAVAVREPTPAEIAQQEAIERAQERRHRYELARVRGQAWQALRGRLEDLGAVLELDRLDYLWPRAAELDGWGRQVWREVGAAELDELLPPAGPVYLDVMEWIGNASQLLQPVNLDTPDDDELPDDDGVIDMETEPEPQPPEPEPEPYEPTPSATDAAGAAVGLVMGLARLIFRA